MQAIDQEIQENLERMCHFARISSSEVGGEEYKEMLRLLQADLIIRKGSSGLTYFDVCDEMLNEIDARIPQETDARELYKGVLALATFQLEGWVDESYNIVYSAIA